MLDRLLQIKCGIHIIDLWKKRMSRLLMLGLFCTIFLLMPRLLEAQCDELQTLHDQKFRWMERQDVDSLSLMLHEELTYVHSNGWMEDKDEVLENLLSKYLIYENVESRILKCTQIGHLGIIHGEGKFTVKLKGKAIIIDLMYTEVYVKEYGRWLLIARHANKKG